MGKGRLKSMRRGSSNCSETSEEGSEVRAGPRSKEAAKNFLFLEVINKLNNLAVCS